MLDAYAVNWLHLLARWLHILAGAAWIGTSFYFIFLNNSVRPPESAHDAGPRVKGVAWMVHGGAFYRTTKYDGAPETLPNTLHWFKWEAYLTWLSGASMLGLIYWGQARAYMIDPSVADLTPGVAVGIGLVTIVGGWFAYDLLVRAFAGRPRLLAALGVLGLTGLSWALTSLLSPRAAYIHVGAVLGTIMAGNVFFVIIPNQRQMVDAMLAGAPPDVSKGAAGALRSLHNNYLTLPVLFTMVSNHFPFTYGSPLPWAVLLAIFLVGGVGRHWFNLRERGAPQPWLLPAVAAGLLALAFAMRPAPREAPAGSAAEPGAAAKPPGPAWSEVAAVFERRCRTCHASSPSHPAFDAPPLGFVMDTPAQIAARRDAIYERTVILRTMPLGNLTEITEAERALVAAWYEAGAAVGEVGP